MLGDKIYDLRTKKGLTQRQLGDIVGVSNKAVSKWETGDANPDVALLPGLALALGVSIDELFGHKAGDPPKAAGSDNGVVVIKYIRKEVKDMKQKIIGFMALGTLIFGLIFGGLGVGMYVGFTVPENRDLRIATNESYAIQTAVITGYDRTGTTMGNETMYRLTFEWDGSTGRTNAVFTGSQARARVGQPIQIRVSDSGRAVPVEYERSAFSILGWVFLGTFGGIGAIAIIAAVVLSIIFVSQKRKSEQG